MLPPLPPHPLQQPAGWLISVPGVCCLQSAPQLWVGFAPSGWTLQARGFPGPFLVISTPHSVARALRERRANAIGGTPSSRIPPSLLPPATSPSLPTPFCLCALPLPSVEPPQPEAGESRDTGVRRGLLEGAEPGGAPGYSAGGWGSGGREGGFTEARGRGSWGGPCDGRWAWGAVGSAPRRG